MCVCVQLQTGMWKLFSSLHVLEQPDRLVTFLNFDPLRSRYKYVNTNIVFPGQKIISLTTCWLKLSHSPGASQQSTIKHQKHHHPYVSVCDGGTSPFYWTSTCWRNPFLKWKILRRRGPMMDHWDRLDGGQSTGVHKTRNNCSSLDKSSIQCITFSWQKCPGRLDSPPIMLPPHHKNKSGFHFHCFQTVDSSIHCAVKNKQIHPQHHQDHRNTNAALQEYLRTCWPQLRGHGARSSLDLNPVKQGSMK